MNPSLDRRHSALFANSDRTPSKERIDRTFTTIHADQALGEATVAWIGWKPEDQARLAVEWTQSKDREAGWAHFKVPVSHFMRHEIVKPLFKREDHTIEISPGHHRARGLLVFPQSEEDRRCVKEGDYLDSPSRRVDPAWIGIIGLNFKPIGNSGWHADEIVFRAVLERPEFKDAQVRAIGNNVEAVGEWREILAVAADDLDTFDRKVRRQVLKAFSKRSLVDQEYRLMRILIDQAQEFK